MVRRPLTLQARLMAAVIGFVSLILVIVAMITSATLGNTLEDQLERQLDATADQLTQRVQQYAVQANLLNVQLTAEYKLGKGDLGIFRSIKYGSDGTGMTGWADRMKDDESWQVVNYVRTLQK